MHYDHIRIPEGGEAITVNRDHSLNVPDFPIIPYIEGDGIGIDVTPVMLDVVSAAVSRAYGEKRAIRWMQVYAGQKASKVYGGDNFLPEETLHALRSYVVSIKGPLTTPVGGGIRSLNVSIRQTMDLFACVRPIRYFPGVSTPMKDSDLVDMTVFRENTEDIYAGIEYPTGSQEVQKLINFLQQELGVTKIRFPASSGIGIKPVSREGSQRLVRKAIQYCIDRDGSSVTLVHKGNIMKPGSLILSAEMLLRYIGWREAADYIVKGVANTIANKELTFDLARLRKAIHRPIRRSRPHDRKEVEHELEELIPGATLVDTRGFGDAVIRHMDD